MPREVTLSWEEYQALKRTETRYEELSQQTHLRNTCDHEAEWVIHAYGRCGKCLKEFPVSHGWLEHVIENKGYVTVHFSEDWGNKVAIYELGRHCETKDT